MDVRMQKYRMTRWLGRLFIVLSLVTSCGAQAATTCTAWQGIWQDTSIHYYSTQLEAAQEVIKRMNAATSYLHAGLTSCDGAMYCYFTASYMNGFFSSVCAVQDTFTITLSGGTEVEPSALLPFNAVVKDQNGVAQPGKQVTITSTVQDGTGGHIHTEKRPKGLFTCSAVGSSTCTLTTDYSGQAPFEFVATPISGSHTITATCVGCVNTATAPVNVKVNNLITIPGSPALYALTDSTGVIGSISGKHTDNHYLTSAAISRLKALALLYTTSVNPNAILYLNDASLVWGGLFDVGSTPWMSPHAKHDRGMSIDIRAANDGVNNEGAVPLTALLFFITQAQRHHFNAGLHCNGSSNTATCYGVPNNRHFHVDL